MGTADQGAVHIHAGEGSQVIGVVRLPTLNPLVQDDEIEAAHEVGTHGVEAASEPKLLAEAAREQEPIP